MYSTLESIQGDTVSTAAKRQSWEEQRLQKMVDKLLQPMYDQIKAQEESIKKAVKEADQAKKEAKLAKQKYEELEKKILCMEVGGQSSQHAALTEKASAENTTIRAASAKAKSSAGAKASQSRSKHSLITITNNTCTFGFYPQDADGTERPILWRVLTVDQTNHKALLLSEKILDCRQYYTSDEQMNWERAGRDSKGLRYWLNHDFYQTAFATKKEQNIILTAAIEASANPNPQFRSDQGRAVQDKIFLLSVKEMIRYFAKNDPDISGNYLKLGLQAAAQGTEYVKKKTAIYQASNGNSSWWLRTMGISGSSAVRVSSIGDVTLNGINTNNVDVGVRPALWVDLNS